MEKKVEVEINGKIVRVSEHMVEDMLLFGAVLTKAKIREKPAELKFPLPKKLKPEEPSVLPPEEINLIPEPKKISRTTKKTKR